MDISIYLADGTLAGRIIVPRSKEDYAWEVIKNCCRCFQDEQIKIEIIPMVDYRGI